MFRFFVPVAAMVAVTACLAGCEALNPPQEVAVEQTEGGSSSLKKLVTGTIPVTVSNPMSPVVGQENEKNVIVDPTILVVEAPAPSPQMPPLVAEEQFPPPEPKSEVAEVGAPAEEPAPEASESGQCSPEGYNWILEEGYLDNKSAAYAVGIYCPGVTAPKKFRVFLETLGGEEMLVQDWTWLNFASKWATQINLVGGTRLVFEVETSLCCCINNGQIASPTYAPSSGQMRCAGDWQ